MKIILFFLAFSIIISCKEKPKPFIYDYVEVGYTHGISAYSCDYYVDIIKIDASKNLYIIPFGSKSAKIGRLSDSSRLQMTIDNFARKLYHDSIINQFKNQDTIDHTNPFFVFIVQKNGFKKIYKQYPCYGNKDTCGDISTDEIKFGITSIYNNHDFRIKDTIVNIEVLKLLLPDFYK
ncbi:MAG TPA: hypothetical protein PK431_00095 [Chitinophagales bacterium]|nr:hypothetical protein [Chitinophagales bacterium]